MKKTKVLVIALVLMLIGIIFYTNTKVFAVEDPRLRGMQNPDEGEPVVTSDTEGTIKPGDLKSDSIHNGDLYIVSGRNEYVMDKIVDGNVFFFGNSLKVTGQINGSLFVFGSKLEVDEEAYVACHTFAFANTVDLKGSTYDAYVASDNLSLGDNLVIYRDLRVFSDKIKLSGSIGRNAILYAEKIEAPETENKLTIRGNIIYEANEEISNLDKASITGEAKFTKAIEKAEQNEVARYVWSAVSAVLFNVVLYLALTFFAPKFVEKSKEYASTRSLLAFGIGVAFTILVPMVIIALLFTIIGVSLSFAMTFIYGTVLMLNTLIVAIIITEFLAGKLNLAEDKLKKILLIIPVSIIIWGLKEIPVVGTWVSLIVFFFGVGTVILYQFDKRKKDENSLENKEV